MDERVAGAMGAASAPGLPAAAGLPPWVNTRSRNHTWTGPRLMIFGFALFWVPVLSYVGAVLLLAGVMFVFAGRRAFNDAQGRTRWCSIG